MTTIVLAPTFNERENIKPFLRRLRAAAPDADVLVIDDNSPDGTAAAADEMASELGQIKVLRRVGKAGLGSAYRHGFQVAFDEAYDIIVTMDVDLSHDPAVVPSMIAAIDNGADAAVGSRYVAGGGTVNWPVHRRLLSRWGNRYTAFVLGANTSDCTSGFRCYRATSLAAIDPGSTKADGYAFLTELVRRLANNHATIVEIPITFRDREHGVSKMSGRIIAESMVLVTGWGVSDLLHRRRPKRSAVTG